MSSTDRVENLDRTWALTYSWMDEWERTNWIVLMQLQNNKGQRFQTDLDDWRLTLCLQQISAIFQAISDYTYLTLDQTKERRRRMCYHAILSQPQKEINTKYKIDLSDWRSLQCIRILLYYIAFISSFISAFHSDLWIVPPSPWWYCSQQEQEETSSFNQNLKKDSILW